MDHFDNHLSLLVSVCTEKGWVFAPSVYEEAGFKSWKGEVRGRGFILLTNGSFGNLESMARDLCRKLMSRD